LAAGVVLGGAFGPIKWLVHALSVPPGRASASTLRPA
jgi:hypothetical protein